MEHVDFFKKTLIAILDESPRGTKAKLADSLKINRINLSSYLAGRDNFSEQRKNEISKYFGFSPEEFLVLGMRLFHSDEPFLWALRAIYLDEQRFRDLVNESDISETRFKEIFNIGKSLPLMPEEKEKILEATGFTEKDFLDFGRREILKNPKMKWDLAGQVRQISNSTSVKWNNEPEQPFSPEVDRVTEEHIEIVKKFYHKEQAKRINEDLLVIDQNPEAMREVESFIRGLATGIRISLGSSGMTRPNHPPRSEGNLKNGTE